MMRTIMVALACVLFTAAPATAKKRHVAAHKRAHAAAKKHKGPKALVRVQPSPPPTRVASAEQHPAPAVVSTPAPTPTRTPALSVSDPTPAPSPPVEHGPLGPQAGDDEVPGTRMKR